MKAYVKEMNFGTEFKQSEPIAVFFFKELGLGRSEERGTMDVFISEKKHKELRGIFSYQRKDHSSLIKEETRGKINYCY